MSTAKNLINALKKEVSLQKVNPTYMELIKIFPIQPITSKNQYKIALHTLEKIISHINEEGSSNKGVEDYFDILVKLVSDYEKIQFKPSVVSGTEMLSYLMELQGLNQSDLSRELGGQPVVSKILKGERELNIRQIKALAKRFKVSPKVFL